MAFTLWPIWLTEVAGREKKPFIMIRGGWVAFGGCSVQCAVCGGCSGNEGAAHLNANSLSQATQSN